MRYFRCAQCDLQLTQTLQELRDGNLITPWSDDAPRHDLVPSGWYVRGCQLNKHLGVTFWQDDEWVFNLNDLQHTRLGGTLNGCCGIDGQDGINTFCINGHEIGTEQSDCWTYWQLRVPRANVIGISVNDNE